MSKPRILAKKEHKKTLKDIFFRYLDHLTFKNLDRHAREHIKNGLPQVSIRSFDFIGNCINFQGVYEKDLLDFIFSYLDPLKERFQSATAIDVGANIGNHSLYFSRHFNKVIAIEPHPANFQLLELNRLLSRRNNIFPLNLGISNVPGTLKISHADTANSGSVFLAPSDEADSNENIVYANSLDNILSNEKNISLIKIDVEGMEYETISGAERLIRSQMPIILFEQRENAFTPNGSATIDRLLEFGYNTFAILNTKPNQPKSGPKFIRFLIELTTQIALKKTETLIAVKPHEIKKADYSLILALPDYLVESNFPQPR
jgi:FkbM family methyltransferase